MANPSRKPYKFSNYTCVVFFPQPRFVWSVCQSSVFCFFFINNQINVNAGKPYLWILVRGGTGLLAPKFQISLFLCCQVPRVFCRLQYLVFQRIQAISLPHHFSISPTTYLRTNAMHYILVPMLIASGTAWNTLFCMRSPRRFSIDRDSCIFRTNQLRKTHLDNVSTPTPGPSNTCALRNFKYIFV